MYFALFEGLQLANINVSFFAVCFSVLLPQAIVMVKFNFEMLRTQVFDRCSKQTLRHGMQQRLLFFTKL